MKRSGAATQRRSLRGTGLSITHIFLFYGPDSRAVSQRDCASKPRVGATQERLPWDSRRFRDNPKVGCGSEFRLEMPIVTTDFSDDTDSKPGS